MPRAHGACWFLLLLGTALAATSTARAQPAVSMDDLASAVVQIKAHINPDGRTVQSLGLEREGSGIVISSDGLVLTIDYLMVEAHAVEVTTNGGHAVAANVVGYDHETGFGLLRASAPLGVRPMGLGKSADVKERDPVLIASAGGTDMVAAAHVVAKREFAGGWEYLLEGAIFTAPPHPAWSGAALISREGKLVGVGSLVVANAAGKSDPEPGNMFVPIDKLAPILADLISEGRAQGPSRPWLGLTTEDVSGRLLVTRVAADGPAEKAGLKRGNIIVGVAGQAPKTLADFYRKVWAKGGAGTRVPLDVMQDNTVRRIDVQSINRMDHLKLKSTF